MLNFIQCVLCVCEGDGLTSFSLLLCSCLSQASSVLWEQTHPPLTHPVLKMSFISVPDIFVGIFDLFSLAIDLFFP